MAYCIEYGKKMPTFAAITYSKLAQFICGDRGWVLGTEDSGFTRFESKYGADVVA